MRTDIRRQRRHGYGFGPGVGVGGSILVMPRRYTNTIHRDRVADTKKK